VFPPDGGAPSFMPMPDVYTTNICFGGPDLKTAFITLSTTGRLVAIDWPRPGTPLNFLNR
jgi:gluconolactonase